MNYILASYYNTGSIGNPRYSVYGWYGVAHNEHLGDYKDHYGATSKALSASCIVMIGQGAVVERVVELLAKQN